MQGKNKMKVNGSLGCGGLRASLISSIQKVGVLIFVLTMTACVNYGGRGLQPGVANVSEVIATMGEPAIRWRDADGSQQLAYPRGPAGVHTLMAFFGPDERLARIENVLEMRTFARILPGQHNQADILRLLGPSNPAWTMYFKARDELAWEWLFCSDWNQQARFGVLFDATTGLVRTTYQQPDLRGPRASAPVCSH